MSNFKKLLILIAVLSVLLPLGTATADTGPKPTMDFEFQQQTPGAALTIGSGIFYECEQSDCRDETPLVVGGPQRFTCDSTSCHALAYGFTQYHRLEILFSDGKTRKSNVFQTAYFNSTYKVTIRPDDLLVEPQLGPGVFSDLTPFLYLPVTWLLLCCCCAGILVILLAVFLIRRSRKKK
jgi:hypothetical protein